ncbi:MAG: hypothetical protein L6V85_09015 [Clostridiales bacterium]|nr:MAG: hypothetical protein L6V85_09015 [Clostridiales bacterium]
MQDQPSIIHAKAYSVDDVKRIWGVDVKGEDVNVFTLDKTGVTGGFGYTASVPKNHRRSAPRRRHRHRKVRKTHGKVQGRAAYHRCGRHTFYIAAICLTSTGEGGKRQYPFIKQNSLDNVGVFFSGLPSSKELSPSSARTTP